MEQPTRSLFVFNGKNFVPIAIIDGVNGSLAEPIFLNNNMPLEHKSIYIDLFDHMRKIEDMKRNNIFVPRLINEITNISHTRGLDYYLLSNARCRHCDVYFILKVNRKIDMVRLMLIGDNLVKHSRAGTNLEALAVRLTDGNDKIMNEHALDIIKAKTIIPPWVYEIIVNNGLFFNLNDNPTFII